MKKTMQKIYPILFSVIFLVCGCEIVATDDSRTVVREDYDYQEPDEFEPQPGYQYPQPGHHQHLQPVYYKGRGRIEITHWDVGGGNWLHPKAKITAKVYGKNAQSITLYAISSDGTMNEIKTISCTDGQTVSFNCRYSGEPTLELRLYDNMRRIIARDIRSAK